MTGPTYEVQYRECVGSGGKWKSATKTVTCDKVEVQGKIVRFIKDGRDTFVVQQDQLVYYEEQ